MMNGKELNWVAHFMMKYTAATLHRMCMYVVDRKLLGWLAPLPLPRVLSLQSSYP